MKLSHILSLPVFLLFFNTGFAQMEFHHAIGAGLKYSFMRNDLNGYGYGATFQYEPRLVIASNLNESSISMNTALGYGFSKSQGLQTSYLEVPVALGFNFGLGASTNSTSVVGGFFDLGYAYFTPAMRVKSNHALPPFNRVEERSGPLQGGYMAVGFRTKNGSSANYSQFRLYYIYSGNGLDAIGIKAAFNFAAYTLKKQPKHVP